MKQNLSLYYHIEIPENHIIHGKKFLNLFWFFPFSKNKLSSSYQNKIVPLTFYLRDEQFQK